MRQKFALLMLTELAKGKRVINVDETWVGSDSFHRSAWFPRNEVPSVSGDEVRPQVSILSAIDTEGRAYVALS